MVVIFSRKFEPNPVPDKGEKYGDGRSPSHVYGKQLRGHGQRWNCWNDSGGTLFIENVMPKRRNWKTSFKSSSGFRWITRSTPRSYNEEYKSISREQEEVRKKRLELDKVVESSFENTALDYLALLRNAKNFGNECQDHTSLRNVI